LLSNTAKQIIKMANSSSKIVYKENLKFITSLCLPDVTVAKEKLGWYALTTLENGLQKTFDYTRAHQQLLINLINGNNT
jgi:nucleoside-diphosphate-sugar epimerase